MRKLIVIGFAAAAVWLVVFYGYRTLVQQRDGFPLAEIVAAEPGRDLPTEPEDWEGAIDYAGLNLQFATLAGQPEMAGLAVAIVEEGDIRFIGTYGAAERKTGERVEPHTVFRWASVSKGVAGTLAAKMAVGGRLSLEAPVGSWQTSLRLPGGGEQRVSLGELMSHQTGLTKNAFDKKLEEDRDPGALRRELAVAPMQCLPGTCHSYQNIAFDASSDILASVAGTLYADAVTEQLFAPLGMTSVSFDRPGLLAADSWARPHASNGDRRPVWERYWRVPAAAGVNSDIVDLARWLRAQMGEEPEILSAEILRLAHSRRTDTHRVYGGALAKALENPGYALGWRNFTYRGRLLVGHSGALDGYRATMVFDPARKVGVAAMWNSNWGFPFRIPFAVLDSFYGDGEADWLTIPREEASTPETT